VVIEVALSVVLLIGAALMVRTFLTLRPVHPGFDVSNRVVAQMVLSGRWEVDRGRERFLDEVVAGVGALPGVVSVSGSSYLPMHGMSDSAVVRLGEATGAVWAGWITPSYVTDMNIPMVRGRAFTAGDTRGAPPVALINEALTRQFWPQGDPLGQIVEVRAPDGTRTTRQIVGILRDTRSWGIDLERHPELYVPFAQQPGSTLFYVIVKTAGSPDPHLPAQIRAIVSAVRPGQVVDSVEPLQDALDRSVAQPRFGAWLFGMFGAMAVGLAGLGLGAVMAWWVAQRTREIGVRIALGAGRAQVVRLVVSQGLLLAAAGAVAGLVLAAFTSRLLAGWLYGVDPLDPATFAGSAVFVLIVSALSSFLPARRAATIDPIVALRAE
jgi:predicted permease